MSFDCLRASKLVTLGYIDFVILYLSPKSPLLIPLIKHKITIQNMLKDHLVKHRLLDSLVVECWQRVREVSASIPSQGPRHTKDVIKMVPVVPLSGTRH